MKEVHVVNSEGGCTLLSLVHDFNSSSRTNEGLEATTSGFRCVRQPVNLGLLLCSAVRGSIYRQ